MISPSRMRELAEEQKADYIENVHFKDKFGEFTCNVDKKGVGIQKKESLFDRRITNV